MDNYWYKNAIIYSLDVETFKDSNNDGIGDFKGLTHVLPYLSGLGVTCIWLLPFFDSPNKDNGYDVSDYYKVDPRLGDLGHFTQFMDAANDMGLRVVMDLPVNHTSTQHPWFQESREGKNSSFKDYYFWEKRKPQNDTHNIMAEAGEEGSNWKYDRKAKAYYYHTFFEHQADLNITNPEVQSEICRIMHFWLKQGVSGFRIDAASYMFKEKGRENFDEDPHEVFRHWRNFVQGTKQDAILLAEVDLRPSEYKKFFGKQDQMHMLFNFYVNNYTFLALAREEATPLINALHKMPQTEEKEQMAIFLRNHDELNLQQLTEKEREEVFEKYAPDENMRIFGRGIRRRLASILNNDRKKIELAFSLLLTLPGTPVIWYGQEIGMGEDLSLEGRRSVHTVMQWADMKNGGFSGAPTKKLITKIITEGPYSYKKTNVNDQKIDPDSLLNWLSRAIRSRKEFKEFGWGKYTVVETGNNKVLMHYSESKKGIGIAIHNFSDKDVHVSLKIEDIADIEDIFGDIRYEKASSNPKNVKLSPYGYRWLHKRNKYL